MRSRSLALAGALAAIGVTAVSAPALAAEQPPQAPAARTSGLLDGLLRGGGGGGLGGIVGGLLGGDQQQPLQDLLGLLQGGQAPTAALLDPVTRLLDQLAATPGLPAGTQALVQQVRALLAGGSGDPLPGTVLLPVATLLRDLAGTDGVPSEVGSLLAQLADVLDGDGSVGGLPVDLSLPQALIGRLNALLQELEGGEEPTGTVLEPVGDLLEQVAGTPGVPDQVSGLLGQLGDALANTAGALDPLLTSQLSLALSTIARTPGLTRETSTTIERIATIIQQSGQASSSARGRAATQRDRALIKRIRVNRARTRIGVRVACPRSAPRACSTVVRASFAGRKAAQGKRVRIAAGRSKVVRLRMVPAARTSSVENGGRLRVRVTTAFGAKRFAVAKSVRLPATSR